MKPVYVCRFMMEGIARFYQKFSFHIFIVVSDDHYESANSFIPFNFLLLQEDQTFRAHGDR